MAAPATVNGERRPNAIGQKRLIRRTEAPTREPGDLPSLGAVNAALLFPRGGRGRKDIVMHIEPGVVDGAKLALSYATAALSLGLVANMAKDTIQNDGGPLSLAARSVVSQERKGANN